jgi:hypothetical protein
MGSSAAGRKLLFRATTFWLEFAKENRAPFCRPIQRNNLEIATHQRDGHDFTVREDSPAIRKF